MRHKKMYIVKREVFAYNIAAATKARGVIYGIELAEDKYQPAFKKAQVGFKKQNGK